MDYLALKHTHMLFVVLSILLFYTRAFSRFGSGKLAANKGVFIASHGVDTLLLVSAIALLVAGSINPLGQPWLLEKIVLVIAYIALGIIGAKSTNRQTQVATFIGATISLLGVGYLASTKGALVL
ncbi:MULTISPECIES: SirB2 family protein [Pseudoalteromonas]|uniref:Transcriptional regulator n=1 Tax=Pseudoalteromonas amylolytica TaxID=1859457 RepID=A0A1S1MK46_9GAMM|nr:MULTISPECIES: SirB2 family protein [Pseudoalteromonas]OHU85753.1 transcriptional regulator [Pseudoalteromonas sp. JW3]OHU87345.1 transcriptional regulator [Pseudoalteromonas amylolytica]